MNTSHIHTQDTPSAVWTITHRLNCYPTVGVRILYNSVLTEILPKNIEFPDTQTVVISFTAPQTGEARLI